MNKRILLTVLGVGVLVLVGSVASVYWYGWLNPLGMGLSRALNLPIASVDDHAISFNDYFDEVEAVKVLFGDEVDEQTIRDQVWKKIVDEAVLKSLAEVYDVDVTQGELDLYAAQLLPQDSDTLVTLSSIYGSRERVAEVVVTPFILEDKITQVLISKGESEEFAYAQNVMSRLAGGEEFLDLQAEVFEKYNSETFSEPFVVTKNQLSQSELGNYILGLKEDDYSTVVASYDGYRIFQVRSKTTDPEEAWELIEIYIPYNPLPKVLVDYKSQLERKFYVPNVVSNV